MSAAQSRNLICRLRVKFLGLFFGKRTCRKTVLCCVSSASRDQALSENIGKVIRGHFYMVASGRETYIMSFRLLSAMLVATACFGCADRLAPERPKMDPAATVPDRSSSTLSKSSPENDRQGPDDTDVVSFDNQTLYVDFPRVGVKLIRPVGFEDAESFFGFTHTEAQSSINVARTPGAVSETANFSAAQLAKHGMILQTKTDVEVDGEAGMLFRVTQGAFAKWILAVGNGDDTVLITAAFPDSTDMTLSNELKAVLLGATFIERTSSVDLPDVGFTLTISDKLKFVERTAGMGKMLLFTKDGVVPLKSPDDPVFIAAPSFRRVTIDNEKQDAERRVRQIVSANVNSIVSNDAITIDELDGFEVVASGTNTESAAPILIYQVILYDHDGGYILMQGLVRESESDDFLPEFKTMAHSMTRQ